MRRDRTDDPPRGERSGHRLRAARIRKAGTGRKDALRDQNGTRAARAFGGHRIPERSTHLLCDARIFQNVRSGIREKGR